MDNNSDILDDQLIHQLYQTMRAFSKTLNNEIFTTGVFSSEWYVLKMVKEHESISQLELANILNVEPAAISKTLTKMANKNLIKRHRVAGKRENYILLTKHAQEIYTQVQAKVDEHRRKALQNLSDDERKIMLDLARRMYDNTLKV